MEDVLFYILAIAFGIFLCTPKKPSGRGDNDRPPGPPWVSNNTRRRRARERRGY